jgi:hypothetical protein
MLPPGVTMGHGPLSVPRSLLLFMRLILYIGFMSAHCTSTSRRVTSSKYSSRSESLNSSIFTAIQVPVVARATASSSMYHSYIQELC